MKLKLMSLKLRNFKGVKNFTFTPFGNNALIYGDNAHHNQDKLNKQRIEDNI